MFSGGQGSGETIRRCVNKAAAQLVGVLLQVSSDRGRAVTPCRGAGGSSCDLDALIARHPPTPPVGRVDRKPRHRPSDPLWWPFLSPRCLTGRKDAVCCPPAPLTCSPLLVPDERKHIIDSRLVSCSPMLVCFVALLPQPPRLPNPSFCPLPPFRLLFLLSLLSAPTPSYCRVPPLFSVGFFLLVKKRINAVNGDLPKFCS